MKSFPNALRPRLGHEGVTLIELMVGLSLAAVAAVVVYTVFVSTQGAYHDTKDLSEVQSDARVVLGMLMQEMRAAGSDPNNNDNIEFEPLSLCDTDSVRLQSDFNGNGVLDAMVEPPEDVMWFHDPGNQTLVRRTPGGDMTILRSVTAFTVDYLDGQGNALTAVPLGPKDRSLVRALRVELRVQVSRDYERTWSTVAALRNDPPTL